MPIRMQKPTDSNSFAIAIEDRFDISEDHIVEVTSLQQFDLVSSIDGKPYVRIGWHFRIFDNEGIAFVNEIDGAAYDFMDFTSTSLFKGGKTAVAREWAGALLGHELSEDECTAIADDFDGALVGKRALASFKLEDDKKNPGTKRMKIALLRPIPPRLRKTAAPTQRPQTAPPAAPAPAMAPNGSAKAQAVPAARESLAEKRARLEAELAAMEGEPEDDDRPF
jgi:hypothetical protein